MKVGEGQVPNPAAGDPGHTHLKGFAGEATGQPRSHHGGHGVELEEENEAHQEPATHRGGPQGESQSPPEEASSDSLGFSRVQIPQPGGRGKEAQFKSTRYSAPMSGSNAKGKKVLPRTLPTRVTSNGSEKTELGVLPTLEARLGTPAKQARRAIFQSPMKPERPAPSKKSVFTIHPGGTRRSRSPNSALRATSGHTVNDANPGGPFPDGSTLDRAPEELRIWPPPSMTLSTTSTGRKTPEERNPSPGIQGTPRQQTPQKKNRSTGRA